MLLVQPMKCYKLITITNLPIIAVPSDCSLSLLLCSRGRDAPSSASFPLLYCHKIKHYHRLYYCCGQVYRHDNTPG